MELEETEGEIGCDKSIVADAAGGGKRSTSSAVRHLLAFRGLRPLWLQLLLDLRRGCSHVLVKGMMISAGFRYPVQ